MEVCRKAEYECDELFYDAKKEKPELDYNTFLCRDDIHQKFGKYLRTDNESNISFAHGMQDYIEPSKRHPENYFKIGYFRSSYNEGGINNVLDLLDLPDLYDIFEVEDSHEYYQKIDWGRAKELVTRLLDTFRPLAQKYFVVNILRYMSNKDTVSPRELLERTIKELGQKEESPFLASG